MWQTALGINTETYLSNNSSYFDRRRTELEFNLSL